jgi:hypothetical protein
MFHSLIFLATNTQQTLQPFVRRLPPTHMSVAHMLATPAKGPAYLSQTLLQIQIYRYRYRYQNKVGIKGAWDWALLCLYNSEASCSCAALT